MNFQITQYQSSDQKQVKQLILAGLKEFGFSYHKELDSDLDDPYNAYIQGGGMLYVCKTADEQVVGTAAIKNKGNKTAELKRLYVDKNFQGQKLGSALLDKAIEFCKNHGFTKLEFETNKKFTKAHLLYQRRGFNIVGMDENSYYMERAI